MRLAVEDRLHRLLGRLPGSDKFKAIGRLLDELFMKSRSVGSSSTTATRRVLREGVSLTGSDMPETNDMGGQLDKSFFVTCLSSGEWFGR
jgi:hypothetical protein